MLCVLYGDPRQQWCLFVPTGAIVEGPSAQCVEPLVKKVRAIPHTSKIFSTFVKAIGICLGDFYTLPNSVAPIIGSVIGYRPIIGVVMHISISGAFPYRLQYIDLLMYCFSPSGDMLTITRFKKWWKKVP